MPLEVPDPLPATAAELLKRKIREDQAVVIVGAGISIAATNRNPCASWKGLLNAGRKRVQENCGDQDDYEDFAKDAEHFLNNPSINNYIDCAKRIKRMLTAKSDELYRQWLKDTIGSLQLENRRPVDAVVELGLPIATTNYDLLIEKSLEPGCYDRLAFTWKDPNAIRHFLRQAAGGRNGGDPGASRKVYHVHGMYLEPHTVVFDAADYDRHISDELAQLWQQYLATSKSIVFVGFGGGLGDPNFFRWLSWIDRYAKVLDTRHFVILQDREHDRVWSRGNRRQRLSNFGRWLTPVTYPSRHDGDHDQLVPFLEELAGDRRRPRPAAGPRPFTLSRLREDLAGHLGRDGIPVYRLSVNDPGEEPASTAGIEVVPLHRRHVQAARDSLGRFPAIAIEGTSQEGDAVELRAEIAAGGQGARAKCRIAIRPLLNDFARRLAGLRPAEGGAAALDGHSRHVLEAALETASRAAEPFIGHGVSSSPAIMLESAPNHDSMDIVIDLLDRSAVPAALVERFRKAIEGQVAALKATSRPRPAGGVPGEDRRPQDRGRRASVDPGRAEGSGPRP